MKKEVSGAKAEINATGSNSDTNKNNGITEYSYCGLGGYCEVIVKLFYKKCRGAI